MRVNKQIFSLLGAICASPYMPGENRLNSQYAKIDTAYEQGQFGGCVAACSALFERLLSGLYLGVMGERAPLSVILSDIDFWKAVDNKAFCDTAGMLQYACYCLTENGGGENDPAKAAKLAKSGLDDVIGYAARFLSQRGEKVCLNPALLKRDDLREPVNRFSESLCEQMDAAGCSGGFSMLPPFMNAALLNFPEREAPAWAGYIGRRLKKAEMLSSPQVHTLDADQIVVERVGMTNEYIRRATARSNGGVLLIEHFEELDMPCAGGNLLDRALKTIAVAAENYRGSLCIVVSGAGESVEQTFERAGAEWGEEYFPLRLSYGKR